MLVSASTTFRIHGKTIDCFWNASKALHRSIRTLDTALRMIELGVSRIGSTASVSIVEELKHRL